MITFHLTISNLATSNRIELQAKSFPLALIEAQQAAKHVFDSDHGAISFRDTSNLAPTFGLSQTIATFRGKPQRDTWIPVPGSIDKLAEVILARRQDGGTFTGPTADEAPAAVLSRIYSWRDQQSRAWRAA